jgi:hypothetical protein
MNIFVHNINGIQVAEMQSEGIVIRSARDAADITGELLISGIAKLILHERNMCPEFWQLSSGLAEVVLQEFASKAIVVAFVGRLSQIKGESFTALIQESGLGNQAFLLGTVELAKAQLSRKIENRQ